MKRECWNGMLVRRFLTTSTEKLKPALPWEDEFNARSIASLFGEMLLFQSSRSKQLVQLARSAHESPLLTKYVETPMRWAVFQRFCGGESFEQCLPIAQHLFEKHRIKAMIDHSTEEMTSKDMLDRNVIAKVSLLREVASKLPQSSAFVPIKATSLIHPAVLEAIAANSVSYVDLKASNLSPEQNLLLQQGTDRLQEVCAAAATSKLSLLLDAEQSNRQPAVDFLYQLLAKQYNSISSLQGRRPVVFNTYQAYLTRAPQALQRDLNYCKQHELAMGVKLVRGAYMCSEISRGSNAVFGSKQRTDDCYDALADELLDLMDIKQDGKHSNIYVMFATHNRMSLDRIVRRMQQTSKTGSPFLGHVDFAQIQGMCDHLTIALGKGGFDVHKLVLFGEYDNLVPWLFRRLEENQDGLGALHAEQVALKNHLRKRIKDRLLDIFGLSLYTI